MQQQSTLLCFKEKYCFKKTLLYVAVFFQTIYYLL